MKGKRLFRLFPAFVLCAMALTSCTKILLLTYGISKPKQKSEREISRFAKKKGLGETGHYSMNFEDFMETFNEEGPPRLDLFDKQGRKIVYTEMEDCNADAEGLLKSIRRENSYPVNDSVTIHGYIDSLYDLRGNPTPLRHDTLYDFTAIVYWASFLGRLNKRDVAQWIREADENPDSKIRLIKINMDMQDWWGALDVESH